MGVRRCLTPLGYGVWVVRNPVLHTIEDGNQPCTTITPITTEGGTGGNGGNGGNGGTGGSTLQGIRKVV